MSISEQEIQTAEAVARIAGAVAPDLFRWIAELFRQGHTEEEVLEIVNIQSRRERYERERAEDMAALDAKHAGVSWVSGPDEPAGHPPRPREHLRGRLGTLGDLLQLRADQTRERQT